MRELENSAHAKPCYRQLSKEATERMIPDVMLPSRAAAVGDIQEDAIATVPVHSRTPSSETGHPIRFQTPGRSSKPLLLMTLQPRTLWLSNCLSSHVAL